MIPPYAIALRRAAVTCIATGVLTCLGTYQTTGRWTPALVAGGISLCTVMIARFGVEGSIDAAIPPTPPTPSVRAK